MVDTVKTRVELIAMALAELLVIGSGQSPEDEDAETVDGRIDGLFGELAGRGICDVADDDAIPIDWSGPLAELLANEVAPYFGRQKMAPPARESIEERLRVLVLRQPPAKRYLSTDTALKPRRTFNYNRWSGGG